MSVVDTIVCPQHSDSRNHRLKLAVVASLGSKVATAALQVVVMPLAIRALGPEQFGVFAMLSSSLIWISSAHMGLGTSLVINISKSVVANDLVAQARAISSAFFAIIGLSAVIMLGMIIYNNQFGMVSLLGDHYQAYSSDIATGFWWLMGCMLVNLILDVFEGAQSGYQEIHIVNMANMLGQALSATTLLIVVYYHAQSIISLIICLYVCSTIPRLLNALFSVTIIRSYLFPRPWYFSYTVLSNLLSTGVAFTIMAVAYFLKHQCGIFLVGRVLGPVSVTSYAIMVNITLLAFGVINMQLRPLLPAFTDAGTRQDHDWIKRIYAKILYYTMWYAVAVGVTLALFGGPIIRVWYGPQAVPSVYLQIAIGVGFVLQAWEMCHHTILFGLGYIWPPVVVFLCQNALMLLMAVPLVHQFGAAGAAIALCVTTVAINCWLLPVMLRRVLYHHSEAKLCVVS